MPKVDSTTSSGAQLNENDEAPSARHDGLASTALKWQSNVVDATLDSMSTLIPFGRHDVADNVSDAYQWAMHNDHDLSQLMERLKADPKKAMASMSDGEASWCLRALSDSDRKSVLDAFAKAGMTRKADAQSVPAGAPKPPSLYEVDDKQAPAVKEFIHGMNVIAARDYDDAYDRYAGSLPNPNAAAPYVNLQEPGSKAQLEEGMTRTIARGAADYVVGKLHDVESAASIARQTRKLGVGDELQLQGGADGVLAGASLGGSLAVKVKRNSDDYSVSPQGAVNIGGTVNGDRISGSATLGGEYHCANVNEVERTATLLGRQVAGVPISSADQIFLNDRLTGLDLKGSVATRLYAELKGDVKLSAGLKAETSAHVDLQSRTLTVSRKYSADSSIQTSSHNGEIPGNADYKLTNSLATGVGGDVTVTTKYTLPAGATWESFKTNPGATLNAIAKQANAPETSVKVHLQAGGRAVDVEGKTKDVELGGIANALRTAGVKAAAQKLVDQSKATVKIDNFTTSGIDFGPKVGSSIDALSVSLKAQRTHHEVKQVATLKEALDQLNG